MTVVIFCSLRVAHRPPYNELCYFQGYNQLYSFSTLMVNQCQHLWSCWQLTVIGMLITFHRVFVLILNGFKVLRQRWSMWLEIAMERVWGELGSPSSQYSQVQDSFIWPVWLPFQRWFGSTYHAYLYEGCPEWCTYLSPCQVLSIPGLSIDCWVRQSIAAIFITVMANLLSCPHWYLL